MPSFCLVNLDLFVVVVTVFEDNVRPQVLTKTMLKSPLREGLQILWPLLWVCVLTFLAGLLQKTFGEQTVIADVTTEAVKEYLKVWVHCLSWQDFDGIGSWPTLQINPRTCIQRS